MKHWTAVINCLLLGTATAEVLVPERSSWQYLKGTAAPSSPSTAWREVGFNAASWVSGPAPFYYGEALGPDTVLSDMRNDYTTLYLLRNFNVFTPEDIDRLALRVFIDDGYIAWINGREVARFNVPEGEQSHTGRAQAGIEPTWTTNSLASPSEYLRVGANVLAVQVFNHSPSSTDIVFDLKLESTEDNAAPRILQLAPPPGTVSELRSLTITFSEPVQGIFAEDLLINNVPAESVAGSGAVYTYTFAQPDFGPVDITFDAGHRIADLADPPHAFDETDFRAQYELKDELPPIAERIVPPPGAAVRQLRAVEVKFSEPVFGIDAGDLMINGVAATNLVPQVSDTYIFEFPSQEEGPVQISWLPGHSIVDLATNSFQAEEWSYVVNPSLPAEQVVISEFLTAAENPAGLTDEDGELQDWIELHNAGASAVNLEGWALTDDPEEPALWTFPDISIPAGARLIVFASGKDRKPTAAGALLHTSFKLGSGGEYLALFNADSPRVAMTEFRDGYPEQRNDYSFGTDPNGAWRYFESPTPGQPNGASSITGVVPKPDVSHKRGWYDAAFTLTLSNTLPGTTIRFTTDGSVPTETSGTVYHEPMAVSSNLVLRAIAYRAGHLPSEVLTHTYLFADHVLRQPNNPPGFPVGQTVHAGYPSDYEMDPEIVNDPRYAPLMKDALRTLPILAISMKTDDMFGAEDGIYMQPTRRGAAWERPCSVEFIPVNGDDFQVDAGIQIQGNAARSPEKTPKHPMRITFKGDYGPKRLNYRVFQDSPVGSFDTLILRADFNYSWLHWNPTQRVRAQRTRDAWVKDTMRAMGGLASHNRYVHLFINGLYWGVYDPSERPDGSFGEAYLGGDKEDYDVINEGTTVDGSRAAYDAMLGITDVSTLAQYEEMKRYLDIPQFIDYMLLHFYIGHEDWFNNKNWYAIRPKDGSRGFLYIPWDGEMVLGNTSINRVSTADLPSGLHPKLAENAQYRMDFADRVQRHFFNGGALTAEENIARWEKRAREMELPILAESARWGDYRRDVHQYQSPPYELYEREVQYRAEQDRLVNTYFPDRTGTVLNQLRTAGLYPSVAAPSFNQHGGKVDPGFLLKITAAAGTVYYTTNGVDPRVYGTGEIAGDANVYSAPVPLPATRHVKARLYSGGNWSALTEAVFTTDSPRIPLRITELMYNPDPAGEAYEYIELQNLGTLPFDASGFSIEGVNYVFPPQSILAPGQIIVIGSAENPTQFAARYPGVTVFGTFGGELVNRGERVALVTPSGQTAQSVDYDDEGGWPEDADGGGFSLEVIDAFGDPDDPGNWQASAAVNGTPGTANSARAQAGVVINEAYATGTPDWVELHNTTDVEVNLAGWTLEDSSNTNIFVFSSDARVAPDGFLVVQCDPFSSDTEDARFGLDRQDETLVLRNAAGTIVDVMRFGPQVSGQSVGRIDGAVDLTMLTPGGPNAPSPRGTAEDLVLNEWLANAAPGAPDWLEVYNTNAELPVSLRGLFLSVSNQVFEISAAAYVGPGGFVQLFADELSNADSVDFKLPAAGANIRLLSAEGNEIDSVSYEMQQENISEGRYPDATETIIPFPITPSPGAANILRFPVTLSLGTAGELILSWPSVSQRLYRVESSEDLFTWTTHKEVTASGGTTSTGESMPENSRYFRVVALP